MTVRKERVTNLFEVGHEFYDNTGDIGDGSQCHLLMP